MADLTRRSFVAGSLALVPASAVPLKALAPDARAIPASRFFHSVGICTHPNWRTRLWGSADWEAAFLESGVMHTRGKIGRGRPGREAVADLQQLFARGVKICATVASQEGDLDLRETAANIDFLANHVGAENLSGIESANEYNKPRSSPPDWAQRLRYFQKWLHDTVRANRALDRVPLIAPSIWGRLTDDYVTLGNLEPYVDRGCLHYYTGGRRPTRAGRPARGDEGGGVSDYALSDAIRQARVLAPTKPLWITEYGYRIEGPGSPLSGHSITERAAAKYLIRGLFDAFSEGVEKTYIYSLVDDVHRDGKHHGLTDGMLRRRQTFHAVRNLMALFADRGGSSAAGALEYGVSNAPPRLKRHLFRKSDGTFLLTMYQDVDSYDRGSRRDLGVAPARVGLNLARPASRIEVFNPTMSGSPVQSASNARTFAIPVADHVTVVRIRPSA